MNATQLIEEIGAIVHSTATAVKSTSLQDRLNTAFSAGLKAFAAAFLASFLAAATATELPQTPPAV